MKEKIVIFIVGLLLGAIIATGSIYFYTVATNNNQSTQMNFGEGQGMSNGNTPPSMPNNNGGAQQAGN